MKILFLDLETTGTSVYSDGIHQISGIIIINGEIKEKFDFKVRPHDGATISTEALAVAHVTLEEVMAYPPMSEVYYKIISILEKYVSKYDKTDKFHIAGYNIGPFDIPFFRRWFSLNGDKFFGSWFWPNCLDVMVLATPALAGQRHLMPNFKQGTVAQYLGIKIDENKLHDALYDVEVCKSIYDIVCNKY